MKKNKRKLSVIWVCKIYILCNPYFKFFREFHSFGWLFSFFFYVCWTNCTHVVSSEISLFRDYLFVFLFVCICRYTLGCVFNSCFFLSHIHNGPSKQSIFQLERKKNKKKQVVISSTWICTDSCSRGRDAEC